MWDFTVQDYSDELPTEGTRSKGPKGGLSVVQKQARNMFCDHESGIDSFDQRAYQDSDGQTFQSYPDCKGTDHHQALAGHVCWLNNQAKQVTCEEPEKGAGSLGDRLHGSFQGAFTHGGLIKCSAIAVVENYLLPKKFLNNGFSKVDLSKKFWTGAGQKIHDNSEEGTDDNAYYIRQQQLAILTDTWAVTRPDNLRPGARPPSPRPPKKEKRDLHKQLTQIYQQTQAYKTLAQQTDRFFKQAEQGRVLRPNLQKKGDDPRQPNLAIAPVGGAAPTEKIVQERGSASYFNTEWRDWERDATPRTRAARGAGYLGCKLGEGC